jgi:cytochrome P450
MIAHLYVDPSIGQPRTNQIHTGGGGLNDAHKDYAHPTIFVSILDSKLPEHKKRDVRLSDDTQVLTMAGTLTTAWALEVVMFWLLRQPKTLRKLKDELKTVIPSLDMIGTLPLPVLEQLPYRNAVMKEGFRLTYGVSCRLARRACWRHGRYYRPCYR